MCPKSAALCHGLPTARHSHCNPSVFSGPRSSLCSSLPGWALPMTVTSCHLILYCFWLRRSFPQEQFPGDCLSKSRFLSLSDSSLHSPISSVLCCAHYYLTEAIHSALQFSRKYSAQYCPRLWRLDAQSP